MAAITNPTQLTPPRVALIDERSGAISREWYRFFLSLLTGVQNNATEQLSPDTTSLIASYDAMVAELAQAVENAPDAASATADLDAKVNALAQAVESAIATGSSETAAIQTQLQALALTPPPKEYRVPRYGSFYDTTIQTAAAINTAYAVTFNSTDLSSGVTLGSPTSRVYTDTPNIYNIQFSAQLDKTSGGVGLVWIWLRKNGTNVPNSSSQIRIQGNDSETVAAWNFLLQMNAGDYFELMWETDSVDIQILYEAGTAVHPAIPSVILTVTDNVSSLEV